MAKRNKLQEKMAAELLSLLSARPDALIKTLLNPDEAGDLSSVDTRIVSEMKRGKDGGLEVKFIDRFKLIETLLSLCPPAEGGDSRELRALLSAIERAAKEEGTWK